MATPRVSQRSKTPSAKRASVERAFEDESSQAPKRRRAVAVAATAAAIRRRARSLFARVDALTEEPEEPEEPEEVVRRKDITYSCQFKVVDSKKKDLKLQKRYFNGSEDARLKAQVF